MNNKFFIWFCDVKLGNFYEVWKWWRWKLKIEGWVSCRLSESTREMTVWSIIGHHVNGTAPFIIVRRPIYSETKRKQAIFKTIHILNLEKKYMNARYKNSIAHRKNNNLVYITWSFEPLSFTNQFLFRWNSSLF